MNPALAMLLTAAVTEAPAVIHAIAGWFDDWLAMQGELSQQVAAKLNVLAPPTLQSAEARADAIAAEPAASDR